MTDTHESNISKICRACGNPHTDDKRAPVLKNNLQKALLDYVGINITQDVKGVHPPCVCHDCDRKLSRWKRRHSKKRDKPKLTSITPANFNPHDEECQICLLKLPVLETEDNTKPTETNLQRAAEVISSANGFITWKGDQAQYIFVTLDQGLCASRAVIIFPDATWKVQVLDIDVRPTSLPKQLEECHLEEIFQCATKPFCRGSPDQTFQVLHPTFKDRSGKKTVSTLDSKFSVVCDGVTVKDTIRSYSCHGIVSGKGVRCPPCAQYRNDLYAKVNEQKKLKSQDGDPSSHARNDYMAPETLSKKSSNLKKENIKLKHQIEQLEAHISGLMEQNAVAVDPLHNSQLTDTFQANCTYMDTILEKGTPQQLLWEQQKKYLELKDPRQMRWHPTIIKWCIALYEKSPVAYKTMRKSNFIKLPHHSTLFKYTHFTEAKVGVNNDILREIVREAKLDTCPEFQRNVTLLFDEMKIKNSLVYSQRSGHIWGFTEMGDINEEVSRFERQVLKEEDPPLASYVLVVMMRGIFSSLKKAVAWYPCTGFTGTQLHNTIWDVVKTVEYAGFYVRALVSDGASPNRKFYSMHGTQSSGTPTYCHPNPVDPSRNVYFICDVPHLIKTTRNCWENSGWNSKSRKLLFRGKEISWVHLVHLYEWDIGIGKKSPGLRMLHRLSPDHIHLTPSLRMRVYLATQVLSSTVAHAMALQEREDVQSTTQVREETRSTVMFINFIDTFFDIMNVSNKFDGTRKRKGALMPFTSMDDPRFQWLTNDFLGFLDEWQNEGDKVVPKLKADEKRRLCLSPQTLEGLRITVYSIVELVPILLDQEGVDYILTEKFSQDPLEEYFSKHRGKGGFNDNPSAFIFGHQFNSLFVSSSASVRSALGMTRNENREEDAVSATDANDPLPKRKRSTKTQNS